MAAKLGVLKGQPADLDRVLCTVQPSGHQWSHQGSKLLLSQLSPGGDHLKFCEESCGPVVLWLAECCKSEVLMVLMVLIFIG